MTCPICTTQPDDTEHLRFHETPHWRVVLAPNQTLLGRCAISTKRHVGDLAALTPTEVLELFALIGRFEAAARAAFGATMFNWSCYMNHHYREAHPDPHIHWWAVPRYDHPVDFARRAFTDPDFGGPYDHARWRDLPLDARRQICTALGAALADAAPTGTLPAV